MKRKTGHRQRTVKQKLLSHKSTRYNIFLGTLFGTSGKIIPIILIRPYHRAVNKLRHVSWPIYHHHRQHHHHHHHQHHHHNHHHHHHHHHHHYHHHHHHHHHHNHTVFLQIFVTIASDNNDRPS